MATELRLPKTIKRVTVLQPQGSSDGGSLAVYREKKKKKKKQSRALRSVEKLTRRNAEASSTFASVYLRRHKRSNRKRRDGWVRDLVGNVARAGQKGAKKLKLTSLLLGL